MKRDFRIWLAVSTHFDVSVPEAARDETAGLFGRAGARLQSDGNGNVPPLVTPNSARIYVVSRVLTALLRTITEKQSNDQRAAMVPLVETPQAASGNRRSL